MKSLYLNALVMMTLTSACVDTDDGTVEDEPATETAALVGGCTVLRPISWNVNGRTCIEDPDSPIILPYGGEYTAVAYGWGIFGTGTTVVRCYGDNDLRTVFRSCRPSIGVPQ